MCQISILSSHPRALPVVEASNKMRTNGGTAWTSRDTGSEWTSVWDVHGQGWLGLFWSKWKESGRLSGHIGILNLGPQGMRSRVLGAGMDWRHWGAQMPLRLPATLSARQPKLVNRVSAEFQSSARDLAPGDGVRQDETIAVEANGRGEIKLNDDTRLALGPGSRIKLDPFVCDPEKTVRDTDHDFSLAAAAAIGFSYEITKQAELDIGYRDTHIEAASGNLDIAGHISTLSVGDEGQHEVRIGVRLSPF